MVINFIKEIKDKDILDKASSLAFHGVLALVPFLVVMVFVSNILIGGLEAREAVFSYLSNRFGESASILYHNIILQLSGANVWYSLVLFVIMLLMSTTFVIHLTRALEYILRPGFTDLEPSLVKKFTRERARAVLSIILLLLIFVGLVLLNTVLRNVFGRVEEVWGPGVSMQMFSYSHYPLVFVVVSGFLTGIYYELSRHSIKVKAAFLSASTVAFVLLILNLFINFFFAMSKTIYFFGTAGFVVAFMMWTYAVMVTILTGALLSKKI